MSLFSILKLYSVLVTLTIIADSSNASVSGLMTCDLSVKTDEMEEDSENRVPESSSSDHKLPNSGSNLYKPDDVTQREKKCYKIREGEIFPSSIETSKLSASGSNKDDCQGTGCSNTETSGLSTCSGSTSNRFQVLYDREQYRDELLKKSLISLMSEALQRMKEIEPVIGYIEKKILEYQKTRKYDKIGLVGSLGNKLYFPELMPDGTYQVESDILYERSIESLSVPITNENTHPTPVIANLEIDTLNETLPLGTLLLKVKSIDGDIDDIERYSFFKKMDESDNIYFKSDSFRMSVPHRFSGSILGESEISTFAPPILQPLYRTFKTHRKILTTKEREITFVILMDKVASIKVPWLDVAEKFKSRQRVWPSEEMIIQVINEGCHLIHKPANGARTYMLEWRLTFAISEQLIISGFTEQQRALFVLIKQIKRKYLDMGTFESGEAKMGLTTYHLKTVMLWLSESVSPETWTKSPFECFISFLKQLEKSLQENFLAHYFIPDINIFEGAWNHKHLQLAESEWLSKNQPMRLLLLEKIEEIMEHPEEYLVPDILWATDEKHAHEREKTPVVENIFGDLLHSMMDKELGVRNELNLDVEKIKELVSSLHKEENQDELEAGTDETQTDEMRDSMNETQTDEMEDNNDQETEMDGNNDQT